MLRYAHSTDGIEWVRTGEQVIEQRHSDEALARPSVLIEESRRQMWFCHRGNRDLRDGRGSYRIGYGESADGRHWTRFDREAGSPRQAGGSDAHVQGYPNVVRADGRLHLFYNGDGFAHAEGDVG